MIDRLVLTRDACRIIAEQIVAMTTGGGSTTILLNSLHSQGTRWARNAIHTGGETQQTDMTILRAIRGARGVARTNVLDETSLRRCVSNAESLVQFSGENPDQYTDISLPIRPHLQPLLWFDATIRADASTQARAIVHAVDSAAQMQFLSTGYVETAAQGRAVYNTDGLFCYYPYTTAQYSVAVRDREGTASGWAGIDFNDWNRIDPIHLAEIALNKCRLSKNPIAIEPGRYTTILEPQAVCDLCAPMVETGLDRAYAEMGGGPFADPDRPGYSRIGQHVLDPRITIGADPMDPDDGFVPFEDSGEPYRPVNWIERGVLKALSYSRFYGQRQLMEDQALPNSSAFRMSGGSTPLEEMISNTQRGVLVTRFNNVRILDLKSMLLGGNTRNGLWLIEQGKITKAIKNFRFTESPLFVLNNVEALGIPQRVFRPSAPAVVPPLLVRDFSFTGVMDAV